MDTIAQGQQLIQELLLKLTRRQDLTREEAAAAMAALMAGEVTPAQVAGFLVALQMKGETVEEITGFAETMRSMATPIRTTRSPLIDTCGTGGDHSGSFNISTTTAFVVAGAGIAVAKHGNRSATSKCGSADVLEALGVRIDAPPQKVGQCVDEVGIGFLFARTLHDAMKHVAPTRHELRVRTVFNILGPLTNPAGARRQVMGVFDRRLLEPLAHVLRNLGSEHAFVVAGSDGMDEFTLAGPTFVAEATAEGVRSYQVEPSELGLALADAAAIAGGDADYNAVLLRNVLRGEKGPRRDIVVLNAAAAIRAAGIAQDWRQARVVAEESLDSGKALAKLEALIKVSNDS
jgi:anthranilate phosphoribosyltransferase